MLLKRVLATLHRWAESGWAGPVVGLWGLLQSSFVPGPSDALLIPLGLADPRKVYRLAGWAAVSATLGGVIVYSVGASASTETGRELLGQLGISARMLDSMIDGFARHGWWLVFFGAIGPLSAKLVSAVAGMLGMSLPIFVGSLALGRAVRFFALAVMIHAGGERLQEWVRRRRGTA